MIRGDERRTTRSQTRNDETQKTKVDKKLLLDLNTKLTFGHLKQLKKPVRLFEKPVRVKNIKPTPKKKKMVTLQEVMDKLNEGTTHQT